MHGKCVIHIPLLPFSSFPRLTGLGFSTRSTLTSGTGLKTRHFGTIISELTSCIDIHTACDSRLGGVSLEFTGELNDEGFSVTECLGGSMELSEEELGLRYQVRHSFVFFRFFLFFGPLPFERLF